jgi:basic membrane protein A
MALFGSIHQRSTSIRSVFALVLAIGLVAASCGSERVGVTESAAEAPLEVRVITTMGTDVGLWDPMHFAVYTEIADSLGENLEVAEAVAYGAADQVLDTWGAQGVDLVLSTSNGYEEHLLKAAAKYPDTNWVMMSALSTTNGLSNITAYSVNWCDKGFAIGAMMGVATESGKIGHVGAIDILPQEQYLAAMEFGAQQINPDITFTNRNTGDFIDIAKAQEVASALIADGNDVLATFHGGASREIAARVQNEGAKFVGFLADHEEFAPDAVVSSVGMNYAGGYREVMENTASGTFQAAIHTKSFDEGFLEAFPLRLGFEAQQTRIEGLIDQLMAGDLAYPEGACGGVAPGSQTS